MRNMLVTVYDTRIRLTRFADVIRIVLKERGLRQEDLASAIINLPEKRPLCPTGARQYINRLEHYKVCPSSLRAEAIINYLHIDVDYIINFPIADDEYAQVFETGMTKIEKIFRDADPELIERVVSYAEFLYSR